MMEGFFWLRTIAATYSYFWYPALLLILPPGKASSNLAPLPVHKAAIVIAARNEASEITGKPVVIPVISGVIQPAGISAYLETMILGEPVVITRGASTEGTLQVDLSVTGPPGDAQALRDAVRRVWNDDALRQRLPDNGRQYKLSLGDHERLLADLRSAIHRQCPTHLAMPPVQ